MRVLTFPMQCVRCQRYFWGELIDQGPMSVVLAALRALCCPYCPSKNISILSGERATEAEAWLREHDAAQREPPEARAE